MRGTEKEQRSSYVQLFTHRCNKPVIYYTAPGTIPDREEKTERKTGRGTHALDRAKANISLVRWETANGIEEAKKKRDRTIQINN